MKKILITAVLAVVCLFFPGCASDSSIKKNEETFFAMDTVVTFTSYGEQNGFSSLCASLLKEAEAELGQKAVISSTESGTVPITDAAAEIISKANEVSVLTDGLYDITIAPLSALWNIREATEPPSEEAILSVLPLIDSDKITLDGNTVSFSENGMAIDLGSAGKGWAGDYLAEKFIENGITSGIVGLGGNIRVFGENPRTDDGLFSVGIRSPFDSGALIAVVHVNDTNVVTSGSYERFFEFEGKRYHHILNPKTGYPSETGLVSVSVICKDGTLADILSTALFVCGEEKGTEILEMLCAEHPELAAVFIREDGTVNCFHTEPYQFSLMNR